MLMSDWWGNALGEKGNSNVRGNMRERENGRGRERERDRERERERDLGQPHGMLAFAFLCAVQKRERRKKVMWCC